MTGDSMSGVMLWVGGLMVLMPLVFAGALLGALWYKNRKKTTPKAREQGAVHGGR